MSVSGLHMAVTGFQTVLANNLVVTAEGSFSCANPLVIWNPYSNQIYKY